MLGAVIAPSNRQASKSQCNPTAISLFSGAGGCSLGFQQASYDIRFAMDIDADAVTSYRRNFTETPCETADVRRFSAEMLLQRAQLESGELDILLGGPPCQGFSSAGVKAGEDPRNSLLQHYVRLLVGVRPKWFLMENVEGLLTNAGGSHIHEAVAAFLEAGYSVNVEKLYAQGYGVPQRRKRVLIVGNRLGHDFIFPEPVTRFSGNIFRKGEITFSTAVGDLPSAAENPDEAVAFRRQPQNELQAYLRGNARSVTDHYSPTLSEIQFERVRNLRAGQTMRHLPEHLQHESFRRRAFRRVMDGTPVEKRGGAPSGLKRLFDNEPSLTITSAATREFVHPTEDRLITLRECARLQTFPDWFRFAGSAVSRIQQIGNAIPPMLARAVAEYISEKYAFGLKYSGTRDPSLRFCLTRSEGMSPALSQTESLLSELVNGKNEQLALLERTNH
ncbi:MAG TPA: DNA cytosine methyltransferase [Verrucomicrobiae bacterium]|jgi:DNA (cytosine-5)-methyltransferase 1|nr:DNA cytosine methyltransferase [Verrucomicrobiae bacterium]